MNYVATNASSLQSKAVKSTKLEPIQRNHPIVLLHSEDLFSWTPARGIILATFYIFSQVIKGVLFPERSKYYFSQC